MLEKLLETRDRRKQRSAGGTIASVMIHAAVIVAAVVATARGGTPPKPARAEGVVYAAPLAPARPPSAPPTPMSAPDLLRPGSGFVAPLDLPTGIPDPPTGPPTDPPSVFAPGRADPGAPATGDPAGAPTGGEAWSAALVEKPALAVRGAPAPTYPDILRRSGVDGEVVALFVVDTSGHVEPGSFRALRQTHPLFGVAVERALPRMRFVAAEVGGRRVRQLVEQLFVFAIER